MDTAAGERATRFAACFTELVSATAINVLSTSISKRIEGETVDTFIIKLSISEFLFKEIKLAKITKIASLYFKLILFFALLTLNCWEGHQNTGSDLGR